MFTFLKKGWKTEDRRRKEAAIPLQAKNLFDLTTGLYEVCDSVPFKGIIADNHT